jgi:hypothetical protein
MGSLGAAESRETTPTHSPHYASDTLERPSEAAIRYAPDGHDRVLR